MADTTVLGSANANVATPSIAYQRMRKRWDLCMALREGTQAMRDAGDTYLPTHKREAQVDWQARRDQSVLYEAYGDAVERLAGKPFQKPVTLTGELPDEVAPIEANVDREGTSLTQFGRDVFDAMIDRGVAYIYVDFMSGVEGQTLPTRDELGGARAHFSLVHAEDLIGWRIEKDRSGRSRVVQIRIKTSETKYPMPDKKPFYEVEREQVRVHNIDGSWELHEQDGTNASMSSTGGWKQIDGGMTDNQPGLPLVPVYAWRTGLMQARPPLEDLAWLNLAHWQSYSDQRNILSFARTGVWTAFGFNEDEQAGITIGPRSLVASTNPEAKFGVAEYNGKSIEHGRQDLLDLEARMEVLGLSPMMDRSGRLTATQRVVDEGRATNDAQQWVRNLEDGFERAFGLAAAWSNQTLPEEFSVDVWSDFGISLRAQDDLDKLIKARGQGEISHETFLRELKRRALLSDTVDVEEEMDRVEAEGPSLSEMEAIPMQPRGAADDEDAA